MPLPVYERHELTMNRLSGHMVAEAKTLPGPRRKVFGLLLVAWVLQEASSAKHDATSGVVLSSVPSTTNPGACEGSAVWSACSRACTVNRSCFNYRYGKWVGTAKIPRVIEAITALADAVISTREDDAHAMCGKLHE